MSTNITPKFSLANEWDNSGAWETVVDFTKINESGVSAREIIKALRALNKK